MTRAGFTFVAAGLFLYFVATQTQIGWLYLFDAVVWSLLIISAILSRHGLRSLHIERQVSLASSGRHQMDGPSEDEAVEITLKITNEGRFPRHFIKVLEDCPFEQPDKRRRAFFITEIKARTTVDLSYTAMCYKRGLYASATATLECRGPLGLTASHRTFTIPLDLTIYPRYYEVDGLSPALAEQAESGLTSRSNSASELYGSREYRFGDPLKHIHWRNTARRGAFMLKEFERASQGSVAVFFPIGRDFGEGRETTLEYSIRIAASLARLCADSGLGMDILAGQTALRNAGWREAMDYLAQLEAGAETGAIEPLIMVDPGRAALAIVPAAAPELVTAASELASRVAWLTVVLLEGFATDENPSLTGELKNANLDVIVCRRGDLEQTVQKLRGRLLPAAGIPRGAD